LGFWASGCGIVADGTQNAILRSAAFLRWRGLYIGHFEEELIVVVWHFELIPSSSDRAHWRNPIAGFTLFGVDLRLGP
jgi:hypothetical protein